MKNLILAGACLLPLISAPSYSAGLEGCYEATSPDGRRYEARISRIYSDRDVGTIYDVQLLIGGRTVQHRHALMSLGSENECFLEMPEIETGADEYFYFGFGLATIGNEPLTAESCNLGTFDLSKQLTGEFDDYDNYLEFGAGDAFTHEPSEESSAVVRRPVPRPCARSSGLLDRNSAK